LFNNFSAAIASSTTGSANKAKYALCFDFFNTASVVNSITPD